MGSFSDALEASLLNHTFGAVTYTPPATWYLAAFTAAPSDTGGGTEATGSGYARVAITNNTTNFPNATGTNPSTKTNGAAFTFPTATGDWSSGANMVAWALFTASSGGTMGPWGALDVPKPVLTGDTLSFAASALTITLD
jgi:hypothetical protein